jgi:NTP pyrophosphatase (non-canonical NTP hydrolase)
MNDIKESLRRVKEELLDSGLIRHCHPQCASYEEDIKALVEAVENNLVVEDKFSLNEYQNQTDKTVTFYRKGFGFAVLYTAMGCAGEGGEYCEKVKKRFRDGEGDHNQPEYWNDPQFKALAMKELGDQLWYVAQAAKCLGFTLADIARANLNKLFSRKERDTLHGSGDER